MIRSWLSHWRKRNFSKTQPVAMNKTCSIYCFKTRLIPGKSHKPVELLDIYHTLLDLCDLPANEKNEGSSLKPLLTNSNYS